VDANTGSMYCRNLLKETSVVVLEFDSNSTGFYELARKKNRQDIPSEQLIDIPLNKSEHSGSSLLDPHRESTRIWGSRMDRKTSKVVKISGDLSSYVVHVDDRPKQKMV